MRGRARPSFSPPRKTIHPPSISFLTGTRSRLVSTVRVSGWRLEHVTRIRCQSGESCASPATHASMPRASRSSQHSPDLFFSPMIALQRVLDFLFRNAFPQIPHAIFGLVYFGKGGEWRPTGAPSHIPGSHQSPHAASESLLTVTCPGQGKAPDGLPHTVASKSSSCRRNFTNSTCEAVDQTCHAIGCEMRQLLSFSA